jgi:hypothetical protein
MSDSNSETDPSKGHEMFDAEGCFDKIPDELRDGVDIESGVEDIIYKLFPGSVEVVDLQVADDSVAGE